MSGKRTTGTALATTYRATNGISFPGPDGREVSKDRGDVFTSAEMSDAIAAGYLVATPDRPADIEVVLDAEADNAPSSGEVKE